MDHTFRNEIAYEIAHPRQSVLAALPLLGMGHGMRVLDLGCGPGAHLGLFARAIGPLGQIVGLDTATDRLALATTLWPAEMASGRITLWAGDHDAIPARDGAFDIAWASAVLHHAADPATTLREMRRVVRPGGLVAILDADLAGSFPILPWPPELEGRLRAAAFAAHLAEYDGKLPYRFSAYIGRELPQLLREAGFSAVQMHPLTEVDRAPLERRRVTQIRDWFLGPFAGRLRDFLAPRDLAQLHRLFDRSQPGNLLDAPDFFLSRTYFLACGQVSPTG